MNEMVPVDAGAAPRPPRTPLMVGARPMAIVPQSMEDCYRIANAVCEAKMAPPGLDTPAKAMVAIMHGLEIGLTPMAALQRIAVVNGRPTIWGDGAMSLVRASGLCEYVSESIEGVGDKRVAVCEAMRKGERAAIRRTFSVDDAKRAGLWDTREKVTRKNRDGNSSYEARNDAPWYRYPERMMQMRARAFCLRDGFADVLGGLYLKEELDSGDDHVAPVQQVSRAPSPSAAPMIEHQPSAAQPAPQPAPGPRRPPSPGPAPQPQPTSAEPVQQAAKSPEPSKQATGYDPEKVRSSFEKAAKEAPDRDELNNVWERIVGPWWDNDVMPPDRDDLDRLYRLRAAELDGTEGASP